MQLLALPTTLLLLTSVVSVTAIPVAPSTANSLQARQNDVGTIGGGLENHEVTNSNTGSSNDKKNGAKDPTVVGGGPIGDPHKI